MPGPGGWSLGILDKAKERWAAAQAKPKSMYFGVGHVFWTCPRCHTVQDATSQVCRTCGMPQAQAAAQEAARAMVAPTGAVRTCPRCNTANLPAANFCAKCGNRF